MAALARSVVERLIFGAEQSRRHTQDSPILPDVWIRFAEQPGTAHDLMLEPKRGAALPALATALASALDRGQCELAYNDTHAVAKVTLTEVVRIVLPMTSWWHTHVFPDDVTPLREVLALPAARLAVLLSGGTVRPSQGKTKRKRPPVTLTSDARWLLNLLGTLRVAELATTAPLQFATEDLAAALLELLGPIASRNQPLPPLIWTVTLNREGSVSMWQSAGTVKADAARRLFSVNCASLCWAVIDTGIDATHPAFRIRDRGTVRKLGKSWAADTRVVATYDFTNVRKLFDPHSADAAAMAAKNPKIAQFRQRLIDGRAIDWSMLLDDDTFRIPHDARYRPPVHPHGTHVSGILAGDWRRGDPGYDESDDYDLIGLCPDLRILDLRVLGDDGTGNEFAITAALQFLQFLNRSAVQKVHGANLSLSIKHDVSNYACGRTPVCDEVTRLVASGVVAVAAAGNLGYVKYLTEQGASDAYRNISITDPGNADAAITVGSVHRSRPHNYGVSYFSSRGPTGDGRVKPDVVAPGEKIKSAAPGGLSKTLDGTSQAAPHVSGAAAMLMARHSELMGDPATIKSILAKTATDLGRERYFQGGGLIDILRALQSV